MTGLRASEIAAYDAAWPDCRAALARGTRALTACLAAATGTHRGDPHLREVVRWLARHESDAAS